MYLKTFNVFYSKLDIPRKCRIPYAYGGEDNYFCTLIQSQFKCEIPGSSTTYEPCKLGIYLSFKTQ